MSKPLIVIPARMGSARFPGKPLALISGVSMIRRTAQIAASVTDAKYVVATDHEDIKNHCQSFAIPVVMTDAELKTGSDRSLAAAKLFRPESDIIVNLQGDAPFTDVSHIRAILEKLQNSQADIATPAIQLDWASLDDLRRAKTLTPFSGTTVIETNGRARWFSKTILPAIRNESILRGKSTLSPVLRHVGLYAFKRQALGRFSVLSSTRNETFEGLEQLRALENNMHIEVVKVDPPHISSSGIDTPADLARAEALIEKFGDPFTS